MLPRNVRRIRSRTQRTASDSGVLRKGELAGPTFITHDIVGRIARARRIAVVEDPRQKKAAPDMGAAPPDTERHRIERRTFRPLVTTDAMQQIVLDAVSVAQRHRPPRQASSPERIVHSPVRSHVTARTCRHSAGAPSRHAVAIDHSPSAGGVTTNWPHDHRGTKPAESRTTSKRGEAPSGANEKTSQEKREAGYFHDTELHENQNTTHRTTNEFARNSPRRSQRYEKSSAETNIYV